MQKNTSNDDLVSPKRTVKLLKPNYLSNRNSFANVNRYGVLNNNELPEINNHLSTPMTQEKKNTPQRRPQVVINRHPENQSTFARETVPGNST